MAAQGFDSLGAWFQDRMRYGTSPFAEAAARGIETETLARAAEHDIGVFARVALPCRELKQAIAALLPESWAQAVAGAARVAGRGPL